MGLLLKNDIYIYDTEKTKLLIKPSFFFKQKKKQGELHIHFPCVMNTCGPAAVCMLFIFNWSPTPRSPLLSSQTYQLLMFYLSLLNQKKVAKRSLKINSHTTNPLT